jgi:hypothetical protein
VEQVTAEGEVVVLALQNARFLIKTVNQIARGEAVCESAAYLKLPPLPAQQLTSYAGQTELLVTLLRDR